MTRADIASDLKAELLETMEMLRRRELTTVEAMNRVRAIRQRRLETPDNLALRLGRVFESAA